MKRRNFITLSTLTAFAIGTPFSSCSSPDPELDKKISIPQTLSQLLDQNSIKAIGRAFGVDRPDEYSVKKLERNLSKDAKGDYFSSTTPLKEISETINRNTQGDFDDGNTLILDGWVLSLTEARQCALFSLIYQN